MQRLEALGWRPAVGLRDGIESTTGGLWNPWRRSASVVKRRLPLLAEPSVVIALMIGELDYMPSLNRIIDQLSDAGIPIRRRNVSYESRERVWRAQRLYPQYPIAPELNLPPYRNLSRLWDSWNVDRL